MKRSVSCIVALAILLCLPGCGMTPNEYALELGKPPENAVKLRAVQTRRYDTVDETLLLISATQIMQDLGFTISESNGQLGIIGGSKQRDAEEAGQVAGSVALSVALALLGAYVAPTWDKEQTIRATVVLTPLENSSQTDVRIFFDRLLTNNHGDLWRSEIILEPEIYQEFFAKFSEAVFLEGNEI